MKTRVLEKAFWNPKNKLRRGGGGGRWGDKSICRGRPWVLIRNSFLSFSATRQQRPNVLEKAFWNPPIICDETGAGVGEGIRLFVVGGRGSYSKILICFPQPRDNNKTKVLKKGILKRSNILWRGGNGGWWGDMSICCRRPGPWVIIQHSTFVFCQLRDNNSHTSSSRFSETHKYVSTRWGPSVSEEISLFVVGGRGYCIVLYVLFYRHM